MEGYDYILEDAIWGQDNLHSKTKTQMEIKMYM